MPSAPSFSLMAAAIACVAASCMGPATTSASRPAALRSATSAAKPSLPRASSSAPARALPASASTPPMPSSLATSAANTATSLRRSAKRSSELMPVTVTDGSATYMRESSCFDGSAASTRRFFAHSAEWNTPVDGQPRRSASRTSATFALPRNGSARAEPPRTAFDASTAASAASVFHEPHHAFG